MEKMLIISLLCFVPHITKPADPDHEPLLKELCWGVSARQGKRTFMEDTYAVAYPFKADPSAAFAGIYDGHSGDQVATMVSKGYISPLEVYTPPLHEQIDIQSLYNNPKEEFERVYHAADATAQNAFPRSGTTAVTIVISHASDMPKLYVAWAGDSRAVLAKMNGDVLATRDHKPNAQTEEKRIKDAGSTITKPDIHRLGGLPVSRSIGNKILKQHEKAIIATPETEVFNLSPNDRCIILASDGVWDVLHSETAARIVLHALNTQLNDYPVQDNCIENGNNKRAILAARALRDNAYARGSSDNISALVIEFIWHRQNTSPSMELLSMPFESTEYGALCNRFHEINQEIEGISNDLNSSLDTKDANIRAAICQYIEHANYVKNIIDSLFNRDTTEGADKYTELQRYIDNYGNTKNALKALLNFELRLIEMRCIHINSNANLAPIIGEIDRTENYITGALLPQPIARDNIMRLIDLVEYYNQLTDKILTLEHQS